MLDGERDAVDEALAVKGVVADGEPLARRAEEHLLVGDQSGQANGVNLDPVDRLGAAGSFERVANRRVAKGPRPASRRAPAMPAAVVMRGARGGVDFLVVVELDDLDALEVRRGHRREALGEHRTDREVRGDDDADVSRGVDERATLFTRPVPSCRARVRPGAPRTTPPSRPRRRARRNRRPRRPLRRRGHSSEVA